MTAIIIQHLPNEGAGVLSDVLSSHGIAIHEEEIYRGGALPALENFELMLVLGGYQQVWQTDRYPWLVREAEAIREWVDVLRKPYFGICLGHQLLAHALGGKVARSETYELGFPEITALEAAQADPLFASIPKNSRWLQWHEAEVVVAPPGFSIMARSEDCAIQAMSRGHEAVSLQYHAEGNPRLIDTWTTTPGIAADLVAQGGPNAIDELRSQAVEHLGSAQENARTLFEKWLSLNNQRKRPSQDQDSAEEVCKRHQLDGD